MSGRAPRRKKVGRKALKAAGTDRQKIKTRKEQRTASAEFLAHLRYCSHPCGKRIYENRQQAAYEAARLRRVTGGEPMRYYRCRENGEWHIGHEPGWRRETGIPRPPQTRWGYGQEGTA